MNFSKKPLKFSRKPIADLLSDYAECARIPGHHASFIGLREKRGATTGIQPEYSCVDEGVE